MSFLNRFLKPDLRLFLGVAAFWLLFWFIYPYRELIDDSRYQMILQHKFLFIDTFMRPIHSWLLYLIGEAGGSMTAVTFVSLTIHLGTGAIVNWQLIPRMPETMRIPARLGLITFLVHPVSLQTIVHVAQASEVLGAFFAVILLSMAMKFIPDHRLTGKSAPRRLVPHKADFIWMAAVAVLALLSKENYFPPLLIVIAAVAWNHRSRSGRNVLLILLPVLAAGVLSNSFSRDTIQNQTNYERSRNYRKAVAEGRLVSAADSIMLPLRDRSENLTLQISLVPLILRVVLAPFWLVKDYGYFPYGKSTYEGLHWQFWIGAGFIALVLVLLILFWKRAPLPIWALILSPFIYYSVFFLFPVYDPLFLYRLYGAVLFLFVIAIPALSLVGAPSVSRERWIDALSVLFTALAVTGGIARAYEMRDPVEETALELRRRPDNHRLYVAHLHALLNAKRVPLDCQSLMEPALTFAPSAALIYIEWGWCHSVQGQIAEARARALQSLEYESVPENIHVALDYLITPEGFSFAPNKIHPANLPYILNK